MGANSAIAWTDNTANFWMGCHKISPGCAHCYADTLTSGKMGLKVWGEHAPRQRVKSIDANLRRWNRAAAARLVPNIDQRMALGLQGFNRYRLHDHVGRKTFVMSLGDFFEDHPMADDLRVEAWFAMRANDALIYQILTKRHDNIVDHLPHDWPWPNAWLGVSVENQHFADIRIPALCDIPATRRWLSVEPLLGPVVIRPALLRCLDWVIVGGESGVGYRPMDHAWARALRDQCVDAGVSFFFKQSSAYHTERGTALEELDGSRWIWKQYPGELTPPIQVG